LTAAVFPATHKMSQQGLEAKLAESQARKAQLEAETELVR
jgi:hypothetical protein